MSCDQVRLRSCATARVSLPVQRSIYRSMGGHVPPHCKVQRDSPMSCRITADPISIQFRMKTRVGPRDQVLCGVELGRYRFLSRYRFFGFLVGFFKSRYRFRYRFFKISRYRFRFSVFPHEPTVAYRITPSLTPYGLPFPPNGVWALELQIAAIRDSDIVTIDNL